MRGALQDAKQVRVHLRNNSLEQRAFKVNFVTRLIAAGISHYNPSFRLVFAVFSVPNPWSAMFGSTANLCMVDLFTFLHLFALPKIKHELSKLSASRCFAIFNFLKGCWQLPLSMCLQKCQSFISADGIHSPTSVLYGMANAVVYLHSTLAAILPAKLCSFAPWRWQTSPSTRP